MPLFHFSENPNIERFVPRPPVNHPDAVSTVWAIDEWHSPFTTSPRLAKDKPRVGLVRLRSSWRRSKSEN
jgi:hypothetical protein